MPDPSSIIQPIKRTLNVLVISTVILYGVMTGVAVRFYHDSHQTQKALCALRSDLTQRVTSSQDFLIKNPNGIPGISAKVIQDDINNQERTVLALRNLSC